MSLHLVDSVEAQREAEFPWEEHAYYKFLQLIESKLTPDATLVDIGCARAAPFLGGFKGKAGTLIGVDVEEFTNTDPDLTLIQESATAMPSIPDNSVDLAYSASLMEHIEDIDTALAEIRRILKPGGEYVWIAPNWYHYPYFIASIVPNGLHPLIVNLTEGRAKEDVFPTHYKINTEKEARALAAKHGWEIADYRHLGNEPQYMRFSRYAFWLGARLENYLRARESRHWQLAWMLVTMRKPEAG